MENSRTIRAPMVAVYDQASSEADIRLPPDSVEKLMVKSESVAKPLRHKCSFLASGG